ncbi:unnamed protein product [Pylaiella littoralis]
MKNSGQQLILWTKKGRAIWQISWIESRHTTGANNVHDTVPYDIHQRWKQCSTGVRAPSERPVLPRHVGRARAEVKAPRQPLRRRVCGPWLHRPPDDERGSRGQPESNFLTWKSVRRAPSVVSYNWAELVPEAANLLREHGHPEMASILDNITEGCRKVIHSRDSFSAKVPSTGLHP